MKRLPLFLFLFLTIACGSQKENTQSSAVENSTSNTDLARVELRIYHREPYCGGAPPGDDLLENLVKPQLSAVFYLMDYGRQTENAIKTDSLGLITLELDTGKYAIKEAYKHVSFAEFLKINKPEPKQFIESQGDECYKTWWASNLGEIRITKLDSVYQYYWETDERCFTGKNPCLNYTGPMPP